MRSGNFPWLSVMAGISFVILYTLGEYGNSAYREYFKSVGLGATGLIVLLWFIQYCPAVALYLVVYLLIAALIAKAVLWFYFKANKQTYSA